MKLKPRYIFLTINLILFTTLLCYLWFTMLSEYASSYYYEAAKNEMILISIFLVAAMITSSILILMISKEAKPETIDIGKH